MEGFWAARARGLISLHVFCTIPIMYVLRFFALTVCVSASTAELLLPGLIISTLLVIVMDSPPSDIAAQLLSEMAKEQDAQSAPSWQWDSHPFLSHDTQ